MANYLDVVRSVNSEHPHLLQTNINSTCYEFIVHVIDALRQKGVPAFHICKTRGEGQYIPPGFQPRDVKGLDGKIYQITGVSHDAIWIKDDGVLKQVDTIAQGNDSPDPINMVGIPVWNEIPQMYWRPNNPPLDGNLPVPPIGITVPGYEEIGGDNFFTANVGVPLEADMALAGQPLNAGSSVWFSRTLYDVLVAFINKKQSEVPAIIKKHRNEWRRILGLPEIA